MEFSVRESLRFGWETYKKRPWFFAGVTLLIGLADAGASIVGNMFGENLPWAVFGVITNAILGTFVYLGMTAFFLKAHDDPGAVRAGDLWHPQTFWPYLWTGIVVSIIVVFGFLLLIIPGVIFALALMFTSYLVVDRGLWPVEAINESRRITGGHRWRLLGFMLALAGVNILGLLALLVGLLVSIPVSLLALVHAYRTLSRSATPAV